MTPAEWSLSGSDGELRVHTGVTGRAAKIGHRLTMTMNGWQAAVHWIGAEPVTAELTVDVGSLEILRGEGGVTPLSASEKAVAQSNALKSLEAHRFPEIRFEADDIAKTGDCYRLTGKLAIHGQRRERVIDLHVDDLGDGWRMSCEAEIRQTDFGVKPFSMLMGAMKVADAVTVSFTARKAKD